MTRTEMAQAILDKLANRDEVLVTVTVSTRQFKVSKMTSEFAMKAFELYAEDVRREKERLPVIPRRNKIVGVYDNNILWDHLLKDLEYAGI